MSENNKNLKSNTSEQDTNNKNMESFKNINLSQQDSIKLSQFKEFFHGKNIPDDKFFKEWKFQKDSSDVSQYFNEYLNSEGIKRIINNQKNWWKTRHPYRKLYSSFDPEGKTKRWFEVAKKVEPSIYTVDMYDDMSVAVTPSLRDTINNQRLIFIGRRPSSTKELTNSQEFIIGHEYAHGKAPFNILGSSQFTSESAQAEALAQNTNTEPGHDSKRSEKHADIWGLRYLLYKEGIYDSRSSQDITIDQIKKLREKYPTLRPFQQMTDEQLQFQLNNVAMIDLENSGIDLAKMGIKIKKENKGKFTDYCGGKVTNECIQRGKNSPNPKIRKRATFAANSRLWKHQKGGPVENFRERSRKEYKLRPKGLDNVVASELNDSIQTSNYFIQNVPIYPTAIKNNNFMGLLNVGLYASPLYFRGFDADKAEAIKKYGKEKGLSNNQIATLIESAWRESNLNARSHKKAHGYWQFSIPAGTYNNYVNWLNGREDNLKSQMDYLLDEYMPKRDDGVNRFGYKKVWTNPKSSLEELAEYFLFEVEAPNEKHELLDRTKRAVKTIKSQL